MTKVDTQRRHTLHESQVVVQDGRVLCEQRFVRARQRATVVLGILVVVGLAFWGAAAAHGISR